MTGTDLYDPIDVRRRDLLGAAAIGLAIAEFGFGRQAHAASQLAGSSKPGSFGPLKQVDAGVLRVNYAELGPAEGQPAGAIKPAHHTSPEWSQAGSEA